MFFKIFTTLMILTTSVHAQMEYPFYDVKKMEVVKNEDGSTELKNVTAMQLLNSGLGSLLKRIDLIRKAKKHIELEYFIWEIDTAGRVMLTELVKAAQRGVKVRIIVDKSITVFELDEFYAKALKEKGIEVAYYNNGKDPVTQQFRTHRKQLSIDGVEAITGGRNIGDDYFDMDPVYNFLDRDIWIKGDIVKAMTESFNEVWDNGIVLKAREPVVTNIHDDRKPSRHNRAAHRQRVYNRRLREARDFIKLDRKTEKVIKKIEEVGRPILDEVPIHVCPKAIFVSDRPGGKIEDTLTPKKYTERDRLVHKIIDDRIKNIREEFFIVSPYYMLNKYWQAKTQRLLDEGKKVSIFTNSLGATDAFYVSANFYRIVFDWEEKGLIPYIHNSKYAGITDLIDEDVAKTRWGVHSKTHVYDDDSFYVGTYNIDNRSVFFNLEMGVFCEGNKDIVKELKDNIKRRLDVAYEIDGHESAVDKDGNPADVWGHATEKQKKIMKNIELPSKWFEFLM